VFKVQRPGLERLFRLDLEVLQQVAAAVQRHPVWGRGRDWVGIAKECRRVLLRELDFRLEAEHAARFRQQFLDDPLIRIPAVVWELSSRRVLCLDYVPGIKITDRPALLAAGVNPAAVAEKGAASYLQQLVRFGFFHADPHPGNLAVAADGALIYYDFGMMGQISERLRSRLGRMVRAAAARDASALVEELQQAGVIATAIESGSGAAAGAADAHRGAHAAVRHQRARSSVRRPLRPGLWPALSPATGADLRDAGPFHLRGGGPQPRSRL
jgi:Predicted unusual protein kinase